MDSCSDLSFSSISDDGCLGLLYRVKVFVLGDLGSGKTSLVQSLVGSTAKTTDHPTDGVEISLWQPFKSSSENLVDFSLNADEKNLVLEIWDTSGRQVCQGLHQLYLTPSAIYIVVYNSCDQTSLDNVLPLFRSLQARVPGSPVILVSTKTDKNGNDITAHQTRQTILTSLIQSEKNVVSAIRSEIEALKLYLTSEKRLSKTAVNDNKSKKKSTLTEYSTATIQQRILNFELILKNRIKVPSKIFDSSAVSGAGLSDLRKEIVQTALDGQIFPHLRRAAKTACVNLYDEILRLRELETVILTWDDYREIACSQENGFVELNDLETETSFLEKVGGVLDLRKSFDIYKTNGRKFLPKLICVFPGAFANSMCVCHVDDDKKAFRLEARRFWPKDTGFRKPEAYILARSLECIPIQGLIRESLFPLLWQDNNFSPEQIRLMVDAMLALGVLTPHGLLKTHCEGLILPEFQNLSVHQRHYITLLDQLPNIRPQLHWTPKPFKGDLQIGWRFNFPIGKPAGISKRVFAVCHYQASIFKEIYHYQWKNGILLKEGEAVVCIEEDGDNLDIRCRVNADEAGLEEDAAQLSWVMLAPLVMAVDNFLVLNWPGLYTKFQFLLMGSVLFFDKKVETEQIISASSCLQSWLCGSSSVKFKDGEIERELDLSLLFPFREGCICENISSWLDYVSELKEHILAKFKSQLTAPNQKSRNYTFSRRTSSKIPRRFDEKKKVAEIKWNLNDEAPVKDSTTLAPTGGTANAKKTSTQLPAKTENNTEPKNYPPSQPVTQTAQQVQPVGKVIDPEQEQREMYQLSCRFVSMVLATAVAEFVTSENKDNGTKGSFTNVQVQASKVAADAAIAVNTGDIDGTIKALLLAVQQHSGSSKDNSPGKGNIRSKMCVIL